MSRFDQETLFLVEFGVKDKNCVLFTMVCDIYKLKQMQKKPQQKQKKAYLTMSNIFVVHFNCKRYLTIIHSIKSIILFYPNSTLWIPHKNKLLVSDFSILNLKWHYNVNNFLISIFPYGTCCKKVWLNCYLC